MTMISVAAPAWRCKDSRQFVSNSRVLKLTMMTEIPTEISSAGAAWDACARELARDAVSQLGIADTYLRPLPRGNQAQSLQHAPGEEERIKQSCPQCGHKESLTHALDGTLRKIVREENCHRDLRRLPPFLLGECHRKPLQSEAVQKRAEDDAGEAEIGVKLAEDGVRRCSSFVRAQ